MDEAMKKHFSGYPNSVRERLVQLRKLIFKVALKCELGEVEESLKWGEPSYSVKTGSPIRVDWKPRSPSHYYVFFNCNTKLVDTFRELYGDTLVFQGNRAVVMSLSEPIPEDVIEKCFELALTYKLRKHLPLLGA